MTDLTTATEQEIRGELARRKKTQERGPAQLQECTRELLHRAFYWTHNHTLAQSSWTSLNLRYYTSFKLDRGLVLPAWDEVCVYWYVGSKNPEASITRKRELYHSGIHYSHELQRGCVGEVPVEQFKRVWREAKAYAQTFLEQFANLPSVTLAPNPVTASVKPEHQPLAVDIPYAELTDYESGILPGTYQLPGPKYILTPASIDAAAKALAAHAQASRRSSWFYCQTSPREPARIDVLKAKLTLNKPVTGLT